MLNVVTFPFVGNQSASQHHRGLDDCVETVRDNLTEYLTTLEEAASAAGLVNAMLETMGRSMGRLDQQVPRTPGGQPAVGSMGGHSYVDFQTNLVKLAKQVAATSQGMAGKASTNPTELGNLASVLTRDYSSVVEQSRGAAAMTANDEISHRIFQVRVNALVSSFFQTLEYDCGVTNAKTSYMANIFFLYARF